VSFLTFRTPELLSSSAVPVSTTVIFSLYFGWMDVCFVPYSRTVPYGTRYPELFLIRYVDRGTVLPASAQLAFGKGALPRPPFFKIFLRQCLGYESVML
jgi:hypothetical protein